MPYSTRLLSKIVAGNVNLDDLAQLVEGGSRNFSIVCSTEKLPGRAENGPRSTPFRLLMIPKSVLGSVGREEISRQAHTSLHLSICGRGWRVRLSLLKSSPPEQGRREWRWFASYSLAALELAFLTSSRTWLRL